MKNFYYKGIKVNSFGIPVSGKHKAEKPNAFDRNAKRTAIKKRDGYNHSFNSPFQENSPKNLIIMYDIPDNLKKERDWFRRHLIKFGYVMIQRSVWVGPSPLPKEFIKYLDEIKIGNRFKSLKLANSYDSSISAIA